MTCCPNCGADTDKVIYMGLPGRLCRDEDCSTLDGLASLAPPVASNTLYGPAFGFMLYEGSYWCALWVWLTRRDQESQGDAQK